MAKKHLLVPTPVLTLGGAGSGTELCLVPPKQPSLAACVSVLHRKYQNAILASFVRQENIAQKEFCAQVSKEYC